MALPGSMRAAATDSTLWDEEPQLGRRHPGVRPALGDLPVLREFHDVLPAPCDRLGQLLRLQSAIPEHLGNVIRVHVLVVLLDIEEHVPQLPDRLNQIIEHG